MGWPKASVVDPQHFGNLNPHPDLHPHQLEIWIRIKVTNLIRYRIRISLQITSQNVKIK
jgi:hypothetical protein